MSIRYSTNWCGPVSMDWYRERGLTRKVAHTFKHGPKAGETHMIDEIVTHYSAGRIDIRDSSKEGYDGWNEYGLAPMHGEDWNALSDWLDTLETDDLWTYEQLIEYFQYQYGQEIRWAKDLEDWRHIAQ